MAIDVVISVHGEKFETIQLPPGCDMPDVFTDEKIKADAALCALIILFEKIKAKYGIKCGGLSA